MADGITFVRTDEQGMLASTLREMLGESVDGDSVRERSLTVDAFDRDTWSSIAEMGLVGMGLPSSLGGADASTGDVAVLFEELGRVVAPVPLLSAALASSAILAGGSEFQHQALLPSMADGSVIGTVAFFESAHGGPFGGGTTAEQSDVGWRITGSKHFVTDAPNADLFVVSARTHDGPALFVVDASAPGVSVEAVPALDATRPLGTVVLDVEVTDAEHLRAAPAEQVVGEVVDLATVLLAAEQVGGAQWCLDSSVEYAKERYQFGRAIGSFQAVKHMCANMLVAVEQARSVAWHAAASFGDESERAIAVPLAKSVCSDAYLRIAGDTIQVFGGIGFTWEHDAHLRFKRAKADSLLFGSIEAARDRLADAIGV